MSHAPSPADRLRAAMNAGCVQAPGAFNALCARAIARAGFPACYISGAATSVCAGVPDVGLLSLEHFVGSIRQSAVASGLPVIADADTGFGEAEMVRRAVLEYAHAGAAALHIEDQQFPKRCGHLDGKSLVPTDHMAEKVQWAAAAARDAAVRSRGPGAAPALIVCARTDARGVEGFDAAVRRAAEYARAGAEMIFPEGLATEEEFGLFAQRVRDALGSSRRLFLLANMTEFGKTPMIPLSRFASLGYDCVIYPVSLLRISMGATAAALRTLRQHGGLEPLLDQMQTRAQLYELIDYQPGTPWPMPV
ncbi:MAG: methylisocitrate lyase [Planctomyces sp.]|nr:methylisocitrate lyase [Planctomyces sp.]